MKPIPNRLPQPARLTHDFPFHQHTINHETSPPLRLPTHTISTNSAITIPRTRSSTNRSSRTLRLGFPTTTTTTSPSKTTTPTAATLQTPTPRSLLRQSRTPAAARSPRATGAVPKTAASAALAGSAGVETGVVGRGGRRGLVDARRRG